MKKLLRSCLSFFVVFVFLFSSVPSPLLNTPVSAHERARLVPAIFGQYEDQEEKKEQDSPSVQILKKVQEIINGWLKSINDRIEEEDVTGLEVRFLEILRSILEWVKGKIDAEIAGSKGSRGQKSESCPIRVTWRMRSPGFVRG
jgi:hypothetical protein